MFAQGDLATVVSTDLNHCKPLIVSVSCSTPPKSPMNHLKLLLATSAVVKENSLCSNYTAAIQHPVSPHPFFLKIYIQNKHRLTHAATATQYGFLSGVDSNEAESFLYAASNLCSG